MTKKFVLFAAAILAALITFGGTPAQAHCQPGYSCWAHSQGHYSHQQRWSYGQRQMFRPAVRYQQPRPRRICAFALGRMYGDMIPIYC